MRYKVMYNLYKYAGTHVRRDNADGVTFRKLPPPDKQYSQLAVAHKLFVVRQTLLRVPNRQARTRRVHSASVSAHMAAAFFS